MKMELMQLDVKRFQNAWRLDWDQVKLLEKIGQGGAGEVFRGLINQSIPAAIKIMKSNGGAIVNLSSVAGLIASPGIVAYGASKGAVRQLPNR